MAAEQLDITGHRGLAITNSLVRRAGDGRRLALLFPGLTYRNSMPALYYPRQLLLARGYHVLTVDCAYDQIPDFMASSEEEMVRWVGADARAVLDVALSLNGYEHVAIVGKSLGTAAMALAVPDEPRLASADLVWLTPGFKTPGVLDGMARCPQRSFLVIGTADPHYEAAHVQAALDRGTEVVLLPEIDHGLEKPGDVIASLDAMRDVVDRLATWLDFARS